MGGASAVAASSRQPAADDGIRPRRLAIVLSPPGSRSACRVEAPERVLRAWAMLNVADDELCRALITPGAAARLGRQLQAITGELERSLSPALADELRRLTCPEPTAPSTPGEVRVAYASLRGWAGGLVAGMLDQLQVADAQARGRLPVPSRP